MDEVLDKVRQMLLNELNATSSRIYLFGSWARGEQRRSSDIDIAVEHQGTITPSQFAAVRERLEESHIPYRVDVVDLTKAGDDLIKKVRAEGILWKDYTNG